MTPFVSERWLDVCPSPVLLQPSVLYRLSRSLVDVDSINGPLCPLSSPWAQPVVSTAGTEAGRGVWLGYWCLWCFSVWLLEDGPVPTLKVTVLALWLSQYSLLLSPCNPHQSRLRARHAPHLQGTVLCIVDSLHFSCPAHTSHAKWFSNALFKLPNLTFAVLAIPNMRVKGSVLRRTFQEMSRSTSVNCDSWLFI